VNSLLRSEGVKPMVLSNQSPYSIFLYSACAVVFITIISAASYWIKHAHSKNEVLEHQAVWQSNRPISFSYQVIYGCMKESHSYVVIHNSNVESVTPKLEGITIEDLYSIAIKGLEEASNVNIEYHPTFGYPIRLQIDWSANTMDDECTYQVTDFQIIK